MLVQNVENWNEWRKANPKIQPHLGRISLRSLTHLSNANLSNAWMQDSDLTLATLQNANLTNARLWGAAMRGSDLRSATLTNAELNNADLSECNMSDANLRGADLSSANLSNASFNNADLTGANLSRAMLVGTSFSGATLTGCNIYGVAVWDVALANTVQNDLIISKKDEPVITVDDLVVAQFIYLILNNNNLRNVLNSITSKGVLILGRFSDPQRKAVLDGLREKLRHLDLLPMVFDFDRPTDKDYTETIQTLAGISMFVIADITSPKSTPLELEATVKHFKIPYVPIIDTSVDKRPFAMLVDSQKSFHWVLPTLEYEKMEDLLDDQNLKDYIIDPVNKKRDELRKAKSDEPETITIRKKAVIVPPS